MENLELFLKRYFEMKEATFTKTEDGPWFCVPFKCKYGLIRVFACTRQEYSQYVFTANLPLFIPQDKRQQIASLLTRLNWNIVIGNFEMDFKDGELRYRSAIKIYDSMSDEDVLEAIDDHFSNTYWMLEGDFATILAVMAGADPAEAIAVQRQAAAKEKACSKLVNN